MANVGECAWAAGILDGEGCIRFHRTGSRRWVSYTLEVSVVNTDIRMLDRLKQLFEGNIKSANKPLHRRPAWEWRLYSAKAANFLELIHPYLVTKREQADLALLSRKYTGRGCRGRGSEFMAANVPEMSRLKQEPGTRLRLANIG